MNTEMMNRMFLYAQVHPDGWQVVYWMTCLFRCTYRISAYYSHDPAAIKCMTLPIHHKPPLLMIMMAGGIYKSTALMVMHTVEFHANQACVNCNQCVYVVCKGIRSLDSVC